MKNTTVEARVLGGIQTPLPQEGTSATIISNMTVDRETLGWSSRIGYEKYRPDPNDEFRPFNNLGRIDSLFVYPGAATGSRDILLVESGGVIYLLHEATKPTVSLLTLITSRSVPSATQNTSTYTAVRDGVVVCNGDQAPILIEPWPLGGTVSAPSTTQFLYRTLGFPAAAAPIDPLRVVTMGTTVGSVEGQSGGAVSLWWPTWNKAIGQWGDWGLGFAKNPDATRGKKALYDYKCSYISDTGSESPLSPAASVQWELEGNVEGFQYCTALRIPRGPEGTIGRRIYRTGNYSTDTTNPNPTLAYLDDVKNNVDELFFDPYASNTLGATAPGANESVPMPVPRARFSAVYKDCLFLDGGVVDPYTLVYSHPDRIDQYAAESFIRLQASAGGITGLFSLYTSLIVLRESGIDVVQGDFANGFVSTTVTNQVACRSANALDSVPGVGLMILAQDGIYLLSGGLVGGAEFTVTRVSDPIEDWVSRITPDCISRAVARYTPLTREMHFYVPIDGEDRPNVGLVYHVDKQAWTVREGFPVSSIDRLYTGELVFGHNEGVTPSTQNDPAGLFVISNSRHMGGFLDNDQYFLNGPPTSKYKSAWLDLGDAQAQKQVHYVTIWVKTEGSQGIKLSAYKDHQLNATSQTSEYKLQPPDKTLKRVMGPTTFPTRETAIFNTDAWQRADFVPMRFSVATQSAAWFAFEIESVEDFTLVGWEIEFTARGTRVIKGHSV